VGRRGPFYIELSVSRLGASVPVISQDDHRCVKINLHVHVRVEDLYILLPSGGHPVVHLCSPPLVHWRSRFALHPVFGPLGWLTVVLLYLNSETPDHAERLFQGAITHPRRTHDPEKPSNVIRSRDLANRITNA
jgi:hypothetical protein